MEMLLGFLGGIAFWPALIVLVEMCALTAFVAHDRGGFATISVIVTLVLLQWLGYPVISFVWQNPLTVVVWVLGYLALGISYSFFKWDRTVAKWRREYDESPKSKQDHMWSRRPVASARKDRILGWMMFWPWSFFWWVVADFVKELFLSIYKHLGGLYDKVTSRHTHDLESVHAKD
ncbi:MAG: hypothetical protein RLZZ234_15 [Candidatus Parcubacteria bacterium]